MSWIFLTASFIKKGLPGDEPPHTPHPTLPLPSHKPLSGDRPADHVTIHSAPKVGTLSFFSLRESFQYHEGLCASSELQLQLASQAPFSLIRMHLQVDSKAPCYISGCL